MSNKPYRIYPFFPFVVMNDYRNTVIREMLGKHGMPTRMVHDSFIYDVERKRMSEQELADWLKDEHTKAMMKQIQELDAKKKQKEVDLTVPKVLQTAKRCPDKLNNQDMQELKHYLRIYIDRHMIDCCDNGRMVAEGLWQQIDIKIKAKEMGLYE